MITRIPVSHLIERETPGSKGDHVSKSKEHSEKAQMLTSGRHTHVYTVAFSTPPDTGVHTPTHTSNKNKLETFMHIEHLSK